MNEPVVEYNRFFDRDLSWLAFNERVLEEAAKESVPLIERIKFLAIYSSNLDEFYRVRIPILLALHKISTKRSIELPDHLSNAQQAKQIIQKQLERFGQILLAGILPLLKANDIYLIYNETPPEIIKHSLTDYFYSQVLAFLRPVFLSKKRFYPKNNELYFLIILSNDDGNEEIVALNIPSDKLPRFFNITIANKLYIIFLDDIIRYNLDKLFKGHTVKGCYTFKATRDAELDLEDEYPGDIAEQIEKQLSKRDFGIATRFLYQPGIPLRTLEMMIQELGLENASIVEGGYYHNLKDLATIPLKNDALSYTHWPGINHPSVQIDQTLFDQVAKCDIIFHFPYHSYNTILRFFNEASADPDVKEIYVSLYRVASDSRIVNALISAAKSGKKVQVLVELKARFDEANNLKWAKKLKKAGAKIIYSSAALKVHAKIALVKREENKRTKYYGLLGTGNFNEGTAKFYTDHILMTSNHDLLREVELLFMFLAKKEQPSLHDTIGFKHLLVSRFNLQQRLLELIDREIMYARQGLQGSVIIKLNNLEEKILISKLYDASKAGVKIQLLVRGICCLVPGVTGLSENIEIKRIVDRYLEHGRIFIFNNNGDKEVFLGSADLMNRNIYRRIEVCFPVYDDLIKQEIIIIVDIQLSDNTQAVTIDDNLNNVPVVTIGKPIESQFEIYQSLKNK